MFWRLLTIACCLYLVAVAISNIRVALDTAGLIYVTDRIESGKGTPDPKSAASLARQIDRALTSCQSILSRAATSAGLQRYYAVAADPGALDRPAELEAATAAVEHRLKCDPSDGNAWLIRASLAQLSSSPDATSIEALALDLSYRYAPAEKWIIASRYRYCLNRISGNETEISPRFLTDLYLIVDYFSVDEVADLFVAADARLRPYFIERILTETEHRKAGIVERIDRRLGQSPLRRS